jgi:hypothetical protein
MLFSVADDDRQAAHYAATALSAPFRSWLMFKLPRNPEQGCNWRDQHPCQLQH